MEQNIIAVVAGREIKESDFEKFLQNVPREQQAYLSNPQFRQQCLDQFVALHMFAELGGEMKLEETEEVKSWMALGSRDKSALLTFPQLLRVIDHAWKGHFDDIVRDKGLLHEARLIGHLRNTICHMTEIPDEEIDRVRQTMRDWFRVVAP